MSGGDEGGKKERGKGLEGREEFIPEESGSLEGAVNHSPVVCDPKDLMRMWLSYGLTFEFYILS